MKTDQEIKDLKEIWEKDPIYDLWSVDGFEDHEEDLKKHSESFFAFLRKKNKEKKLLESARIQLKGSSYCIKVKMAIMVAIEALDLDDLNENTNDFESLNNAKGWLETSLNYVDYHQKDVARAMEAEENNNKI